MSAAFGEIRVFTQEKGPDVRLRVFGDEFYARYETVDGYTCLYDPGLGLYCYATLSDGRFTSTRRPDFDCASCRSARASQRDPGCAQHEVRRPVWQPAALPDHRRS